MNTEALFSLYRALLSLFGFFGRCTVLIEVLKNLYIDSSLIFSDIALARWSGVLELVYDRVTSFRAFREFGEFEESRKT